MSSCREGRAWEFDQGAVGTDAEGRHGARTVPIVIGVKELILGMDIGREARETDEKE